MIRGVGSPIKTEIHKKTVKKKIKKRKDKNNQKESESSVEHKEIRCVCGCVCGCVCALFVVFCLFYFVVFWFSQCLWGFLMFVDAFCFHAVGNVYWFMYKFNGIGLIPYKYTVSL